MADDQGVDSGRQQVPWLDTRSPVRAMCFCTGELLLQDPLSNRIILFPCREDVGLGEFPARPVLPHLSTAWQFQEKACPVPHVRLFFIEPRACSCGSSRMKSRQVSRVVHSFLFLEAEDRKPDLGGAFWVTSLRQAAASGSRRPPGTGGGQPGSPAFLRVFHPKEAASRPLLAEQKPS